MGSVRMVLILSVITATLALMSADYSNWVDKQGINTNFEECREVKASQDVFTILSPNQERGIVGLECAEGGTEWFSLIWLIPLGITLLYAFTPFVK